MYDIIIIGAGPAGLTSALYALRAGKKVLLLDKKGYGGQIINATNIENYPGYSSITGLDFATKLYNQIKRLNGELKIEKVIKVEKNKVITEKNTYNTKAIILAPGSTNKKLNLPNEKELLGKGISYCATCDGNFFKEKDIAVVGGGDTALEDAIYLSKIAKKVYLIHHSNIFKGSNYYYEKIKKIPNIEIILNSNITKIVGTTKLEKIILNNKIELTIQGLFIAIGQIPENDIFKNVAKINEKGYIISEDGVHTKIDSIYVAGDAKEKNLRQLLTATSDGAIAATIAIREMED